MPASVTLRLERPAGFEELSDSAWVAKLTVAVEAEEASARKDRIKSGIPIVGRKGVLRASHHDRAQKVEPRRTIRPLIVCRNVERRVRELAAIVAFRAAYKEALGHWSAGDRTVVFPVGTYEMRRFGVECKELGTSWQATPLV
jgi:hypothetical protein